MSDNEELVTGTSSDRDLWHRQKIDYAKLHSRGLDTYPDDQIKVAQDEKSQNGEIKVQEAPRGQDPESSGKLPLEAASLFNLKNEEMTHEMEEQEALLNKSQQLHEKKLALEEKKKKVIKLRGMNTYTDEKTGHSDKSLKGKSSKMGKKTKVPLELDIKICKPAAASRTEESVSYSYNSDNETDIKTLRKDKALWKSVKKELKTLGLHYENFSATDTIISFQTDRSEQTVQTQIRLLLIRVYIVCHSVCIVWTHYSMVEQHSSNFRVITTNSLGVRIFRKFTVVAQVLTHLI